MRHDSTSTPSGGGENKKRKTASPSPAKILMESDSNGLQEILISVHALEDAGNKARDYYFFTNCVSGVSKACFVLQICCSTVQNHSSSTKDCATSGST